MSQYINHRRGKGLGDQFEATDGDANAYDVKSYFKAKLRLRNSLEKTYAS